MSSWLLSDAEASKQAFIHSFIQEGKNALGGISCPTNLLSTILFSDYMRCYSGITQYGLGTHSAQVMGPAKCMTGNSWVI